MNVKNKKKRIIRLVVIFISLLMFLILSPMLFIIIYNSSITYTGYDDDYIKSLSESNKYYETLIYKFYDEYVDYNKYASYKTDTYYSIGKKRILNFMSNYADLSCSYIIFANEKYDSLLNSIKESTTFFENKDDEMAKITFQNWTFEEIYCNYTDLYNEAYEKTFENRNPSFWLGYNSIKKEITFSALLLDYRHELSRDETIIYFSKNFYI